MGLEMHRGEKGGFHVLLLSSPIALPLSGLKAYIFAVDWPLIKDHTPSAGESTREREEKREEIGEGVEDKIVAVCSHLNQFRIHSIASYCDSHFGVFWQV